MEWRFTELGELKTHLKATQLTKEILGQVTEEQKVVPERYVTLGTFILDPTIVILMTVMTAFIGVVAYGAIFVIGFTLYSLTI